MTSAEDEVTSLPVDVVIPCWGAYVRFLDRCLDSVPSVASVHVVGDSAAVAAATARGLQASRIDVLTPGVAREVGRSSGGASFLCLLDVDDQLLTGALDMLVRELSAHPDAVAATADLCGSAAGHRWPARRWARVAVTTGGGPVLLARNCMASVGACVIRRSALPDGMVLFPDLLDEDWHAAVALRSLGTVRRVHAPALAYDVRAGSVSRRPADSAERRRSHDALLGTAVAAGARPLFWWRVAEAAARHYRRARQARADRRWST